MLSLYKLEIFTAVVQSGSFSAAGQRLFMTQPAISQHIQDLEHTIGTPLFLRGRRGVKLTPAGEILYEYTQRILHLVSEAESVVTNVDNLKDGHLNLGATPGVSVYLLPDWVQAFKSRYPNLTTSITTGTTSEIIAGLQGKRLDLGFVEGELDDVNTDSIGTLVLEPIKLYVVVGAKHTWMDRETVCVNELNQQAFITRQPGSRTRVWIDNVLRRHEAFPQIVGEFDNPESIKQAVMSNMGLSILPEYTVRREVNMGLLHLLSFEDATLERSLKLVWNNMQAQNPISRAFLKDLEDRFQSISVLI